jgi:hypothetical protein
MVKTSVAPPYTAEAGINRIRIRMPMVTTEVGSVFVLHFFMVETGVAPPYTAEAGINRIRIRMRMYGHNRSWIRIRIRIVTTEVGSVFFAFRSCATCLAVDFRSCACCYCSRLSFVCLLLLQ